MDTRAERILKMKKLIEKFKNGDPISNKELIKLIDFYSDLKEKVKQLGKEYKLFRVDIIHNLNRLNDYKVARNIED